jgi:hypothetical protein
MHARNSRTADHSDPIRIAACEFEYMFVKAGASTRHIRVNGSTRRDRRTLDAA